MRFSQPLRTSVFALTVVPYLAIALAGRAAAVGTDPTLVLIGANAVASPGGAVAVKVDGTFNFDDLVQFPFPCGLFISLGNNFVRYDFAGNAVAGSDPAVANGITAAEVPGLLSQGSAAVAPAALLHLTSGEIHVALPGSFGNGTASAVVYAILEGGAFVSNSIPVTLP